MTKHVKTLASFILIIAFVASLVGFAAPTAHAGGPVSALRIDVDSSGMVALGYADLVAAGVDLASIDPATFRLTLLGVEIAIEVTGEADGSFDAGDQVRFYGEGRESVYGTANSYRLSWDGAAGLRMAQQNAAPNGATEPTAYRETIHFEQDKQYYSNLPMEEGADHWLMDRWRVTGSAYTTIDTLNYTVDQVVPAASGEASLTVALQGNMQDWYLNPDHHMEFYVNGSYVGETFFDGVVAHTAELTFGNSLLVAGDNIITVKALDDLGAMYDPQGYTNWLDLSYQRQFVGSDAGSRVALDQAGTWQVRVSGFSSSDLLVYDISDPAAVARLTDVQVSGSDLLFGQSLSGAASYWVVSEASLAAPLAVTVDTPSDLKNPANGADYIVITHGDFMAQAQQLADYRAGQGMRTVAVDVQDVYDEFSSGMLDPQAIKDFLYTTYTTWTAPAPRYIVLLGDSSYDFKNNTGVADETYIPPFLSLLDLNIGETAADNQYVDFEGDRLPEMNIGRLPANTAAQAQTLVDKIITYETTSAGADWLNEVLLAADEPDITAGDFPALSDQALPLIPDTVNVDRVYYKTTPGHGTAQAVRDAIMAEVNAGSFLVNYLGHGSPTAWHGSLFTTSDAQNLSNGDKLPIISAFGCEIGYFISPFYPSLAERLVLNPNGGAVAAIASTGKGTSVGQQWLYLGLYDAIFQQHIERLGDAFTYAKQNLATNDSRWPELLDTFHLFGDPALKIQRPAPDVLVDLTATPSDPMPGDQVLLTLSYANQGLEIASDTQVELTLPQGLMVGGTVQQWAMAPNAQQSWNLGDLSSGASGVITLTVTVDPALAGGETLASEALGSTASADDDLSNNMDSVELTVTPRPQAAIEGMAFIDVNGNGLLDAGETTPAAEVFVMLRNTGGQIIASMVVDSSGGYRFENLEGGTYTVEAQPQTSLVHTGPATAQLTVVAGETATANFGFLPTTGVTVVEFSGRSGADGITLTWTVLDESGITGYQVMRADDPNDQPAPLEGGMVAADGLAGPASYSFTDRNAVEGVTYWYSVLVLGDGALVGPIQVTANGAVGGFRMFIPSMQVN